MKIILITLLSLLIPLITLSQETIKVDKTIYTIVDSLPSFGFSRNDLQNYIKLHSKIPTSTTRTKTCTPVYVNIIIEQDGTVTFNGINKGDGKKLDKVAKKVIKKMPKWNPGFQKGEPKRVALIIPFWFV